MIFPHQSTNRVVAAALASLLLLAQPAHGFMGVSTTAPRGSRHAMTMAASGSSSSSSSSTEQGLTKGPVVIFPAQFGVAADYDEVRLFVRG